MKPIILINFKTYKQATGKNALHLAKSIEKVAKKYKNAKFIVAAQAVDIEEIINKTSSLELFAQHAEALEPGKNTGHILMDSVKAVGAKGTLINHSEYRLQIREIEAEIKKAKLLKLKTVVCASNIAMGEKVAKFKPDFIAVEPPELIGGKVSVAEAKPNIIKNAVKQINGNVLVGAGINKAEDLRISLKLGAKGILIASAIATAKNPEKVLSELMKGL